MCQELQFNHLRKLCKYFSATSSTYNLNVDFPDNFHDDAWILNRLILEFKTLHALPSFSFFVFLHSSTQLGEFIFLFSARCAFLRQLPSSNLSSTGVWRRVEASQYDTLLFLFQQLQTFFILCQVYSCKKRKNKNI